MLRATPPNSFKQHVTSNLPPSTLTKTPAKDSRTPAKDRLYRELVRQEKDLPYHNILDNLCSYFSKRNGLLTEVVKYFLFT